MFQPSDASSPRVIRLGTAAVVASSLYQNEHLKFGHYGATASFVGTMRDFNMDASVTHMTLEHYPAMTQHFLDDLCHQGAENGYQQQKISTS